MNCKRKSTTATSRWIIACKRLTQTWGVIVVEVLAVVPVHPDGTRSTVAPAASMADDGNSSNSCSVTDDNN